MIQDGALLTRYHKSNWIFFIILVISITCQISSTSATSNNTQSYKLLTRQGWETSYPEEGGQMVMTCTSDDPAQDVYVRNVQDEIVTEKNKSIVYLPWNLTAESIGASFRCLPEPTFGRESFAIQHILCDPFPLIPPVQDCKETQVCMLDKTNNHVCEKIDEDTCFLADKDYMNKYFNTSFPTYRTACVDLGGNLNKNLETSYGLCHARSIKKGPFVGMAANYDKCDIFTKLLLNSKEVQEGGVLFESQHPSLWKIEYRSKWTKMDMITCQLKNLDGARVASFSGDQLKYTNGSRKLEYPEKLRLHCEFKKDYIKVISTYIITYSNDMSHYQLELNIKNMAANNETLDLECKVTVPKGLSSVLWWQGDTEPKDQETIKAVKNLPISKTNLKYETHTSSIRYTCMVAVYAFEYPLSFNLIQLNDIVANDTKLIGPKEFGKNENKAPEDESKTTKSHEHNRKQSPEPNTEHVSEADTGSSNAADDVGTNNKSNSWIIILVVVFVVFAIFALVGGGFVYWKKSKRKPLPMPIVAAVPAIKSKKTARPKSAADVLLSKMQSAPDHADVGFIYAFHAKMRELLVAGFGDISEELKKFDFLKRITTEWDRLTSMPVPADAGYIPTCRYQQNIILNSSWVYRNTATLEKTAKRRRDAVSKPKSLHISKFIGLKTTFYLSQAPLKKEMPLFLEYIFVTKITTIIALFSDDDGFDFSIAKVHRVFAFFDYFDINQGSEATYGDFTLQCTLVEETRARENGPLFRTRQIVLKQISTNKTILIRLLTFFGWKDFKSVANVDYIIKIYEFMSADRTARNVLVHCSAGWGRTGTFVACAVCFQYLESHPTPISIFELVKQLRSDRYGAVQTINQYSLVYWAVAHYLKTKFKKNTPTDDAKSASIAVKTNPYQYLLGN